MNALQVGEGNVGVGDLQVYNERAAKSTTFWVSVKGKVAAGDNVKTIWSMREQLKDMVMAVPCQRLRLA